MQAGNLVDSDVASRVSRVLVNGVQRPVESWSVSRELSGDLPEQVVAGSGIVQATGSITWLTSGDTFHGAQNPWNTSFGWVPKRGDKVEIFAGDGASEWKQFTGVIDKTTGSIGESFTSSIIDTYDKLSAGVQHDPLLRWMPPLVPGEPYRGVGLVSTYYVDMAMRAGGFYCTPKQEPNAVVHIPCQGGIWPHSGTVSAATTFTPDPVLRHAENRHAPWGFSVCNFRAAYLPRYTSPSSVPVQMTVMIAPDHAGFFTGKIFFGSSELRLYVTSNRTVLAYTSTGTLLESCRLSAAQMVGATVVTVMLKNGSVTLRNSLGTTVSGAGNVGSSPTSRIEMAGDKETRVAGFQVNHPTEPYLELRPTLFVPSAVIGTGDVSHLGTLGASKAVENVSAVDLITEISKATLSAMWIDELGVMQWVPSMVLRNQPAVQAVTTLNDIFSLEWEDSLLASRSKVTVKYKFPSITTSSQQNVELYVGNGASLGAGESTEEIASPGEDEAWIMPHEHFTRIGTYNWPPYNQRRGTFVGVYYSSDGQTVSETGLTTAITMEKLGLQTYKFVHTAGAYPPGVESNVSTSPSSADLWENRRGQYLPRLGGFGKVKWTSAEVHPEGPGGAGPELILDGGIWLAPEIASKVASFVQSQTVSSLPTIQGMEVVPDPRRQLGDSIVIESENLMGVFIKALIVGIENSGRSSEHTQTLTVRIIGVTKRSVTYQEFNDSLAESTLTYAQWQALGPIPETYSQFNSTS